MTSGQLRNFLMTGVSVAALTIGTSGLAQADSLTIEAEGGWLRSFGDEVVYGTFEESGPPITDTNYGVERGEDYTGRGRLTWHLNDWLSVSGGGGAASLSDSGEMPQAALFPTSFIFPQLIDVPNYIGFCPTCESVYEDGSASLDTDIDFYDFDVGVDVGIGRRGKARFFAGARYVGFDETMRGSFSNSAFAYYYYQQLDVTRTSKFEGWGPRIGFTADVPIGVSGFSFGGTVAVAALFGELTTTVESNYSNFYVVPTTERQTSKKDQIAYTVEVAPEIAYTFHGDGFSARIAAGYRFDHYLSMVDTATRQSTFALPSAGRQADDAKFDGPFARVGISFGGENSWAGRD
jgi:hypothetical protein